MLDELSPAIALSNARHAAAEQSAPIAWRLALPLIGSASAVLWFLVGKAVAFLVA